MNMASLAAKGVQPRASVQAWLPDWELCFDVHHWFRHEGGVGNIRPREGGMVRGVLHVIEPVHLERLDAVESYGVGYDRITVPVQTDEGVIEAITYVGLPGYIDRSCKPTQRYLNILVAGARAAGIDPAYVDALERRPVHQPDDYPLFRPPERSEGAWPWFDAGALPADHTALAGAVFDMAGCREKHRCLLPLLGGRDGTLFHLRRMDTSVGDETIARVLADDLRDDQRRYLHAYLDEYAREYRYAGRCRYPETESDR